MAWSQDVKTCQKVKLKPRSQKYAVLFNRMPIAYVYSYACIQSPSSKRVNEADKVKASAPGYLLPNRQLTPRSEMAQHNNFEVLLVCFFLHPN